MDQLVELTVGNGQLGTRTASRLLLDLPTTTRGWRHTTQVLARVWDDLRCRPQEAPSPISVSVLKVG